MIKIIKWFCKNYAYVSCPSSSTKIFFAKKDRDSYMSLIILEEETVSYLKIKEFIRAKETTNRRTSLTL